MATREGVVGFFGTGEFSPRQVQFLTLATLTSGFCLRRQYAAFAGINDGACVHRLFERLVKYRWATALRLSPNRGYVYHLAGLARTVRHQEGQYRAGLSVPLVARKIMLLDAVVDEPRVDWYVTEEDKIALFRERFNVPDCDLPARVCTAHKYGFKPVSKYFQERLPIGLVGDPPTAHFVYLATTARVRGFKHFLDQHAALFRRFVRWTVVVAYPRSVQNLSTHWATFDRFAKLWPRYAVPHDLDTLRWYFEKWRAVEQRDGANLRVADVERFHGLRHRFRGERIEMLFRRWLIEGDDAFKPPATPPPPCGHFILRRLDHGYDQFGSVPGEY